MKDIHIYICAWERGDSAGSVGAFEANSSTPTACYTSPYSLLQRRRNTHKYHAHNNHGMREERKHGRVRDEDIVPKAKAISEIPGRKATQRGIHYEVKARKRVIDKLTIEVLMKRNNGGAMA
jgi:hypothetical protein